MGGGKGETGHEDLESTEAEVLGGAVEENMDAVAGGVAKESTVVKERAVVEERGVTERKGVTEEKVKIDGEAIVSVVKNTLVDVYDTGKKMK